MVDLITKKSISFGMYNIRDVWHWSKKLEDVQLCWVPRECNIHADTLAKQVTVNDPSFQFHKYVPSVVIHSLHCDYISSSI